jgi:hypothetical protein
VTDAVAAEILIFQLRPACARRDLHSFLDEGGLMNAANPR